MTEPHMMRVSMDVPLQMTGRRFMAMMGIISPTRDRLIEFCYAATVACTERGVIPDVVHAESSGYPINVYPTRVLMDVWNGVKFDGVKQDKVDVNAMLDELRARGEVQK